MREFLCLLDAAVPYVVLLPTGSVSADIPEEAKALIAWAAPRAARYQAVEELAAAPVVEEEALGSGFAAVVVASEEIVADPDLFTGEE
ncbi:MAG: hypothetical protein GY820_39525 [Gammaproteobacteria bacterium]|nr:hypothetical protein [Gammaproteobacteria bacterium]